MIRLLLSLLLISHFSFGQENYFKKGDFIVEIGALPPFIINGKLGWTFTDNGAIGVYADATDILNERKEAGVFGRKYFGKNRFQFYLQGETGYGSFKPWNFDISNKERPLKSNYEAPFSAFKMNGGGGFSYRITPTLRIGNESKLGFVPGKGLSSLSFLFTLNHRFKI